MMTVLVAIAALGGLATVLAALLAVANRWLAVREDPRIEQLESMLPRTNCGGCGLPGCRPFAEALLAGTVQPGGCTVSSETEQLAIARYLGVDAGIREKRVARLACAGGINVARMRARYSGLQSCRAAALVGGGGKGCAWGCLGFGDCVDVCDFDALHLNRFDLPVVDEAKCTACNACVEICPKALFSLQTLSHRLWVACKSEAAGDGILDDCEVACTACARCAADAPPGLIEMKNNLPAIDYAHFQATSRPIQRCPTGAIVWIDPERGMQRGTESRKTVRTEPRRAGSAWDEQI